MRDLSVRAVDCSALKRARTPMNVATEIKKPLPISVKGGGRVSYRSILQLIPATPLLNSPAPTMRAIPGVY